MPDTGFSFSDFGTYRPGRTGLTATGSTQADAAPLHAAVNLFTSVPGGSGCQLPLVQASNTLEIVVHNRDVNSLNIYPPSGGQIEALGINAPFVLQAGCSVLLQCFDPPLAPGRHWSAVLELGGTASGGFLPTAGGTMTGPLIFTATGTSTARSVQDRFSDWENVLDYGAVPNTSTDSAPAFNAACAAAGSRDIFIPAGTYRLNGQVNVQPNQVLRGASDHSSVLYIDQAFSSSANGVFSLNGFEGGGPVLRDLYIQFAQPPTVSTTTIATSGVGATTITVASAANIAVNNYVADATNSAAIPAATTITNIAGNVLTLSAAVVAPGVGNGDTIQFGPSRTNFKTLAAGGTSGLGGSGIMYPPAIYASPSLCSRARLENLHIGGAWDGIYGVPSWLTNIEMGALHMGWNTDGINALDAVHVKGWHSWYFDLNAGLGPLNTAHDGQAVAWNLGRIDGLNATGISFVGSQLVVTANAIGGGVPWTIQGLMLDGNSAAMSVAGGILRLSGFYSSGNNPTPVQVSGGQVSITNWYVAQGGTLPVVSVTGGILQMSGGYMPLANGTQTAITQSSGILAFVNNYIAGPATLTAPTISQTGGVIAVLNNVMHVGSSGTAVSIGVDNVANVVANNIFPGYSITIPATPLAGTYQQGGYGSATPWGQQLALGSQNQGGRVDFRRGSDGAATAWIGMSAAVASNNFTLTTTAGSSQVVLNAAAGGYVVSQVASTEVGRFSVQGIGAAKVTASAVAPGAGLATLAFVAGTNAGTGKLVAYCGTSATAVTIMDNIGAGF